MFYTKSYGGFRTKFDKYNKFNIFSLIIILIAAQLNQLICFLNYT